MKKIIYIANVRLPTEKAHGIQIMKMCQAFANQGIDVELVIPWRFNEIKQDIFEYYGIKKNFKIRKIFSIDLISLNIPRIGFWIQSISFAKLAFIYLLFKKADVIYTRDNFFLYWLSLFRDNFVCEVHIPSRYLFWYKRFNKLIVITKKIKEYLVDKGISEEKVLVAPDGVDLKQFNIKVEKDKRKRVLYIGHLYQWKGAEVLAEAAKLLDDITVIFIGGTNRDIKKFREKYGKVKNIDIKGHIPYKEVPVWMKKADVLVLPNSGKEMTSRYWTSPMKMFEYMACQKPIVASDLPSIREILNEGNAILVQPDNPKLLAKGIEKALENDNISKQAFKDVQQYTWDKRVKKILGFING